MTHCNDDKLISAYQRLCNGISVDALGDTRELMQIAANFGVTSGLYLNESAVLKQLIRLRKRGMIGGDKRTQQPKEEVLSLDPGEVLEGEGSKHYIFSVQVQVTFELLARTVEIMPLMPVTRGEVLSYLRGNGDLIMGCLNTPGRAARDCCRRLFPELVQ